MLKIAGFTSLLLCLPIGNHAATGGAVAGPNAGIKITTLPGDKTGAQILVAPDGRVVAWKGDGKSDPEVNNPASGTTIARLAGNAILDTGGTLQMKFEDDGRIIVPDMKGKPRFDSANAMLDDNGVRTLWLTREGTPMLNMNGTPGPLPFKVQGVTAENRRMAVLLTLYMFSAKPTPAKSGPSALAKPKEAPAAGTGAGK